MQVSKFTVIRALTRVLLLLALAAAARPAASQNILLDRITTCGPLICYPSAASEHQYHYLPREPRLVYRADGTPEFSFLRYVSTPQRTADYSGMVTADGGAVVHLLVSYETTQAERGAALEALREADRDAVLAGPVTFEEGHFALVSSIASLPDPTRERLLKEQPEASRFAYAVAGVGRAPLLEGLKSAISIHLNKLGADILWGSFQTATPDISLVFDLTYSGLRDPANVTIIGDWTKLQEHVEASVGAAVGYGPIELGFDYDDLWDKAVATGAIEIRAVGDVAALQPYVERAYERLQELMFEPVPVEVYQDAGPDLANMIQQMMHASSGGPRNPQAMGNAKPFHVTLKGGYKRREIERQGTFRLDFQRQSAERVTTSMAGNIGNLHARFHANDRIFRTVNIGDDPVYRYRPIAVVVDLRDTTDFEKYVNSVTFRLIKLHDSGRSSIGQLIVTRSTFQEGASMMLGYPWDGDSSFESWMAYDYEVVWSFLGGARHREAGRSTDSAFTLSAPYQYRQVRFIADRETLGARNVKLVTVRVAHEFYGRTRTETVTLGRGMDLYADTREFAVPPGSEGLKYNITWRLENDGRIESGERYSKEQIIWVDELP